MNNLKIIQEVFSIDNIEYVNLPIESKNFIDKITIKLKDLDYIISSFDNCYFKIITKHPQYTICFDSNFPQDLANKMILAYIGTKDEESLSKKE